MALTETPEVKGEELKAQLERRDFKSIRQFFRDQEIADVGEIFAVITLEECIPLFRLVPRVRRAELFAYLPYERQEELLEELPEVVVTSIANEMEPDDRTRLLEDLPFEIRNRILLKLSPKERKIAWQLLSYPEGSIGRLMTPEFLVLTAQMKVAEALELMRWNQKYPEDQLHYLFVIDSEGRYIGDVSLASLVIADPPTKKINEVMTSKQVSLKASEEQSHAVDYFRKYDKSFFPIVDDADVLVGIVTADDVFDVAEEEATEDIHQFGGSSTLEDSYFQTPIFTLFRKRAGWLALLFAGGTITATALKHYEHYAVSMVWLVFFLPLIVSSGGNTGSQTASLVIRGIAVREMVVNDWFKVLWREVIVGLGLGLVLATFGYLRAVAWDLDPIIGVVVAVTLVTVVMFGAIMGAMLPFIFKRLNLDPAVSSSPLLAQLVDIIGVVIFYNMARLVMDYWHIAIGGS